MGGLWVPGSSFLSKVASPSLETGATSLSVIGERPPWLETMGWEGSRRLAVLSISELEDTDSWGNGWLVLAPSQLCVCSLLRLRQWGRLGMKFQTHDPEGCRGLGQELSWFRGFLVCQMTR